MRLFGELIGMAFQIKDDLFDYGDEAIGKPTGIDIKEKKMTLPLIYALNQSAPKERKWLLNSVKNHNTDKKRVKEMIENVKTIEVLENAIKVMKNNKNQALEVQDDHNAYLMPKSISTKRKKMAPQFSEES